MILELNWSKIASFVVPGGQKEKVAHHLMGMFPVNSSIEPKSLSTAKRALDGQFKGARNLTDKSWGNLVQTTARSAGEDKIETNEALENLEEHLKNLEANADIQGNIGKFPLGILGFISAEILPKMNYLLWLKPTLDHEIRLTEAFQKAKLPSEKITALARSDMANTLTGQELIQAYASANSDASKAIYASGLCMLTWFQILVAVWLGDDIETAELKTLATCAVVKESRKSSVDTWFHLLKSRIQTESWEEIYLALAAIRNIDYDWNAKTGIGKLRKIRQGKTPLSFNQANELIVNFREVLQNELSTMIMLERAYRFSVMVDNFQRDWKKANTKSQLLPSLDLSNALEIGYKSLQQRSRGQ